MFRRAWNRNRAKSRAARLDVAKDIPGTPQKQNPVSGRIRFIPLELVVWNFEFCSDIDMGTPVRFIRLIVGYDGVGPAVIDVNLVRPIRIGLATT